MQDRFLPLEKRKELIKEIELLKKQIPESNEPIIEKSKSKDTTWILKLVSIVISSISVIAGIISLFSNIKKEKEKDAEIENQIIETENLKINKKHTIEFEKKIIKIIESYNGVKTIKKDDKRNCIFDLEFEFNKKKYFVEVKYFTRSKVGLNNFQKFIDYQKGLEGEFWFIYNTGVTDMVKRKVAECNKFSLSNKKIVLINAQNEIYFKRQLEKLLSST